MLLLALFACGNAETDTAPVVPEDGCVTDDEFVANAVAPLLGRDCIACHVPYGPAGATRYLLEPFASPEANARNWAMLSALIVDSEDGAKLFLEKPTARASHGGGLRVEELSADYAVLAEIVARLQSPGGCEFPGERPPTCDSGELYPGTAPLRRQTPTQLVNSVRGLLGVTLPESAFPGTTPGGLRTFAALNPVSAAGAEQFMFAAERVSAAVDVPELLQCSGTEPEVDCARRWLHDFTERAFRRPLTTREQALSTKFLDAGLDVDTAVRMQIELVLQTPQFLYLDARPVGEPEADGPVAIEAWQVAARLSYFLTDAPPDEALRTAVRDGHFTTDAEIAAHAARLARSDEALRSVANFHRDWLHLWRLDGLQRDSAAYPGFDPSITDAMLQETDLFTTEVVWSGDARFDTLLFGTSSWVTPELAAIYGVTTPSSGWSRVELAAAERPGVLSRTAFLTAHAYAADSSPVRRGAWVVQSLLCEDLTPPADVDMNLPDTSTEFPTIRERLAAHRTQPSCATCHDRMDPIGLSFEHFGAVGEWRDVWDDGHDVDATGTLEAPAGSFDGASEMLTLLASDPRLERCYARRVFEYGVGRGAEVEDGCTLRVLSDRFDASGGDLHQLWVDVALTDAFRFRHPVETP